MLPAISTLATAYLTRIEFGQKCFFTPPCRYLANSNTTIRPPGRKIERRRPTVSLSCLTTGSRMPKKPDSTARANGRQLNDVDLRLVSQ